MCYVMFPPNASFNLSLWQSIYTDKSPPNVRSSPSLTFNTAHSSQRYQPQNTKFAKRKHWLRKLSRKSEKFSVVLISRDAAKCPNRSQVTDHNAAQKDPLRFHCEELWENDYPSFSDLTRLAFIRPSFLVHNIGLPIHLSGSHLFSTRPEKVAGNKANRSAELIWTHRPRLRIAAILPNPRSVVLSKCWCVTQRQNEMNKRCCCFEVSAVFRIVDCMNDCELSVEIWKARASRRETSRLYRHFLLFWRCHFYSKNPGARISETGWIFNRLSFVKCAQMNKTKATDREPKPSPADWASRVNTWSTDSI